jgi:hypothetical protein
MANKKLQMKEYNGSTWDNLQPVTDIQYVNGITSSIGAFLGTPSSANLRTAVTDETGTGNLVFSNAPTLTSPVISTITNTGTLTLPTASGTVLSSNNTATVINKTFNLTDNTLTASFAQLNTAIVDATIVSTTASQTLTNKTLTSPVIATISNSGATITVPTITGSLLATTASGASGQFLKSNGAGALPSFESLNDIQINTTGDITGGNISATKSASVAGNLIVSGTTSLKTSLNGVVLASSGVLSAGSASLTSQVTGVLPSANGGTGINNAGRTLTVNGASGTLSFASASSATLTIPETGTAVLTAANQQLTNKIFVDSSTQFRDGGTGNEYMKFDLALISTGSTETPSIVTLSVPNISGSIIVNSGAQTLSDKTLSTGTVSSAVVVQKSPVITLSGDLTGTVTLTNLGNGTLTASIAANSVALGTDTTGNYVASLVAGTGITVGAAAEGATPTITNNGVTSLVAGTNMAVSSGTGAVTISTIANPTFSGTVSIGTLNLTNALRVSNGGTGLTSYTTGSIVYASATTTLAPLTAAALGNALISGGASTAPSWGKIGLGTHVSGTLAVINGGTGVDTSTGTGNVVLSANPTFTGRVDFANGSAAAPSINWTGSSSRGFYYTGTGTGVSGNLSTTGFLQSAGKIYAGDNYVCDTPSTTGGSANAIWVLDAGTQYSLYRVSSARKYKVLEEEVDLGLKALNLKPKKWYDKAEYEKNDNKVDGLKKYIGFIAEDLVEVGLQDLVVFNPDGTPDSISYDRLVASVIPILKYQQEQIKSLAARIEALEGN